MRLFPTPKAFSVSDWLELATNRLAAPARKRIGREIEEHYAEAVAAHIEEGMSEWDAKAAALTELGDAWAAARRFRKEHLTEGEARNIESMIKNARNVYILPLSYFLFVFLRNLISHGLGGESPHHLILDLVLLLSWVVLPTVSYVLARSKSKLNANSNSPLLILIQSITGFYFWPVLLSLIIFLQSSHGIWLNIWCGGMFVSIFTERVRLWRKLQKIGYWELPPRNTATS